MNEYKDYSQYKVALIDDDEMNIKITSKRLERYKLNIDIGYSAMDLFKLLETNTYDLIFLDNMMPVMEGIIAAKILKGKINDDVINNNFFEFKQYYEKYKDNVYQLPLIVLTADTSLTPEDFINAGFDEYLPKTFQKEDLEKMLAKYLS